MTVTSWQWPERGYKDNILHRWNIKSLFVEKSRLAGTPKSKAPCWLLVMPYATRTPGMNTVDSLLTDTSLRRPPLNNGHLEVAPTFLYSFNAIGVYEINHIRTAGKNQMKNDPRSCERNLRNCVRRLKKNFRILTGFEPVPSRYRCDALIKWAMKPLMLGAGQLCVHMFP